jgi:hypothetical protein
MFKILTRTQAILTQDFCDFLHTLQANAVNTPSLGHDLFFQSSSHPKLLTYILKMSVRK